MAILHPKLAMYVLTAARCDESGGRIEIIVGGHQAKTTTTFLVHRRLLCEHSDYFKVGLRGGRFQEAESGVFNLQEDDPEEFHRWVQWLYSCGTCRWWVRWNRQHGCCPDGDGPGETWCQVEAEHAFMAGDRFLCNKYCLYTLSHFIQHAHVTDFDRLGCILENTTKSSALHRFVRHWLAWQKFKAVDEPRAGLDLGAYPELFSRIEGWSSLDPRKYAIGHWSEDCGANVYSICCHRKFFQIDQQRRLTGNPWAPSAFLFSNPNRRRTVRPLWKRVCREGSIFVWVGFPWHPGGRLVYVWQLTAGGAY
jgi:hypothetical protein